MIVWLWIGGGFMALGTILALAPRLRRRSRPGPLGDSGPEPVSDPEPLASKSHEQVTA
jgi:hypothetical protein